MREVRLLPIQRHKKSEKMGTRRKSKEIRNAMKIFLSGVIISVLVLALFQIHKFSLSFVYIGIENNNHQLKTPNIRSFTDNNVCSMAKQNFRKASGLFGIVTGTQHSGTTIVSQLIMSAPNVYGGEECGVLLAPKPSDFNKVKPYYDWTTRSTSEGFWGISTDQQAMLLKSACHAEMYTQLRRYSGLYSHPSNKNSLILDKTPLYVRMLVDVMDRSPDVPVVVTEKSFDDQMKSLNKRGVKKKLAKLIIKIKDDNLREALGKYPDRLHIVNMTAFYLEPHTVMRQVFEFLGLEWQPEYLTMDALNSKLSLGTKKTLPFDTAAGASSNITNRFLTS